MRIEIDDKQILSFTKKSPERAKWAMREALKMCGGHFRKKMRAFIETGGPGDWPPLNPVTKKLNPNVTHRTPLFGLGRFVRFKYGKSKGTPRVWIGFHKGVAKIARAVQVNKRTRITPEKREYFAKNKIFLKKTTKFIHSPARPIIEPFWKKEKGHIPGYIEGRFFEKFFSKQKPKIGM